MNSMGWFPKCMRAIYGSCATAFALSIQTAACAAAWSAHFQHCSQPNPDPLVRALFLYTFQITQALLVDATVHHLKEPIDQPCAHRTPPLTSQASIWALPCSVGTLLYLDYTFPFLSPCSSLLFSLYLRSAPSILQLPILPSTFNHRHVPPPDQSHTHRHTSRLYP